MNTCPTCSGPMKPLFQSFFCPQDCDRKPPPEPKYGYVFRMDGFFMQRAKVPQDAVVMQLGMLLPRGGAVIRIDRVNRVYSLKNYATQKVDDLPFPDNYIEPEDLQWEPFTL